MKSIVLTKVKVPYGWILFLRLIYSVQEKINSIEKKYPCKATSKFRLIPFPHKSDTVGKIKHISSKLEVYNSSNMEFFSQRCHCDNSGGDDTDARVGICACRRGRVRQHTAAHRSDRRLHLHLLLHHRRAFHHER